MWFNFERYLDVSNDLGKVSSDEVIFDLGVCFEDFSLIFFWFGEVVGFYFWSCGPAEGDHVNGQI